MSGSERPGWVKLVNDDRGEKLKSAWSMFSVAISFAFTLAAAMGLGFLGGRFLDSRLGTDPWLTLIGLAFGVVAAFRILVRDLLRSMAGDVRNGDQPSDEEGA